MDYVIKIVELADGTPAPMNLAGKFIETFADDGSMMGRISTTIRRRRALRFPSQREAWRFWMTQSQVMPLRPDGKPNRPLTALTVLIEPLHTEPGRPVAEDEIRATT